jgi:hypothetical protein
MTYRIAIQNQQTGETMVMMIKAEFPGAAQEEALHLVFRCHGWRHAIALLAGEDEISAPTEWEQDWSRFVAKTVPWITEPADVA